MLTYVPIFLAICAVSTTVITLKKDDKITCIATYNESSSSLYTSPYLALRNDFETEVSYQWDNNEWKNITSLDPDSLQGPVTDERWESFHLQPETHGKRLSKNVPLSFSVCAQDNFEIRVADIKNLAMSIVQYRFPDQKVGTSTRRCSWKHYSIIWEESAIHIWSEGQLIFKQLTSTDHSEKGMLYAKGEPETLMKLHIYDFRLSRKPGITTIPVKSPLESSVIRVCLYVSVDTGCSLKISLENDIRKVRQNITGFNANVKSWRKVQLELQDSTSGNLTLNRINSQQCLKGYWAIDDIHYCSPNIRIRHAEAPNVANDYRCRVLSELKKDAHDSEVLEKIKYCNQTGHLGKDCEINCVKIYGINNPYCKGYKIYDSSITEYFCGWGQTGKNCNESCPGTTWGLNCSRKCEPKCGKCDAIFGNCSHESVTTSTKKVSTTLFQREKTMKTLQIKANISTPSISALEIILWCLGFILVLVSIYFLSRYFLGWNVASFCKRDGNEDMDLVLMNRKTLYTISNKEFDDYIDNLIANRNQCILLSRSFSIVHLINEDLTCIEGSRADNASKNRSQAIIPYDITRVVLEELPDVEGDDYINASYINNLHNRRTYIAAQSPKFGSVQDFWRMVWLEKIELIVMATNFIENDQRKCVEYYPDKVHKVSCFQALSVKCIKHENHEFYDEHLLEIYYFKRSRKIRHLHLKWNIDDDIHFYPNHLVSIVNIIHEYTSAERNPVLLHSCCGVGRIGTLILSDLALHMAKSTDSIDFHALLKKIRDQRPYIVRLDKHFILAHLVVRECLLEQERIFKKDVDNYNLSNVLLNNQLRILNYYSLHDQFVKSSLSGDPNDKKSSMGVYVDGYGIKDKFIVCKQPNHRNAKVFWRTVANQDLKTIVFINNVADNLKTSYIKLSPIDVIYINVLNRRNLQFFEISSIVMGFGQVGEPILFQKEICCIQVYNWQKGQAVPASIENVLHTLQFINKIRVQRVETLVVCNDGKTGSGLFVALDHLICKLETELEIDVCNAVRTVRRCGIPFVNNIDQLQFLYKAAWEFRLKFDPYTQAE